MGDVREDGGVAFIGRGVKGEERVDVEDSDGISVPLVGKCLPCGLFGGFPGDFERISGVIGRTSYVFVGTVDIDDWDTGRRRVSGVL